MIVVINDHMSARTRARHDVIWRKDFGIRELALGQRAAG